VTLYLRVGEPTWLITGSTQVSRVLSESGQKSTCIEIYKKISTQPDPNLWWTGLAREFQPILINLLVVFNLVGSGQNLVKFSLV